MGLHESQSRLFENIVGRSLTFWQAHFPTLKEIFPTQLGAHSAHDFHAAINKVEPSLIRVEADELTYNLHIILRFELEQAMLKGDLLPADLPAAWKDGMQDAPRRHADGRSRRAACRTSIGPAPVSGTSRPTRSATSTPPRSSKRRWRRMPAIGAELEAGRTGALVSWLRENLHRHGKKYTPAELVVRVTGKAAGARRVRPVRDEKVRGPLRFVNWLVQEALRRDR